MSKPILSQSDLNWVHEDDSTTWCDGRGNTVPPGPVLDSVPDPECPGCPACRDLADPAAEKEPGEAQSATDGDHNVQAPVTALSGHSESSHYQRCPVCGGNGLVPNGYYTQTTGIWTTGSTTPEQCRTCAGRGIVR